MRRRDNADVLRDWLDRIHGEGEWDSPGGEEAYRSAILSAFKMEHRDIIKQRDDLLAALRSVPTLGVYESDRDYAIRMAAWLGTRNAAIAKATTPTDSIPRAGDAPIPPGQTPPM